MVRTEGGATPATLNAGLAEITAPVVCRVDARSLVPPHYVRTCVELLADRAELAVVGGAQLAVPRSPAALDLGIARALNNRFGMGLARYRRGAASGPADTVYLGAFRTDQLRRAGGWDERFATNQDFELNRRLGQHGTVWFESSLEVGYLPRPSVRELFEQYRRFGAWKVGYWRDTGDRPRPRQLALIAGPPLAGVATVTLATTGGSRRRSLLVLAALAGAVGIEVGGSPGPPGGLRAHAWSALASLAVSGGWLVGVWAAALRRGPLPSGR